MPSLTQNQSMNGAWIEVFKVGVHTDSNGNTASWTPEKIDSYLARYNPAYHEAPLRIDHPEHRNSKGPAFGWIQEAKRVGDKVYVKLSQVSKQLEDWVKQGFVKKRSIAFDDRYGIHHLAFLGSNCPAVPGMENIYSGSESFINIEFDFSEPGKPLSDAWVEVFKVHVYTGDEDKVLAWTATKIHDGPAEGETPLLLNNPPLFYSGVDMPIVLKPVREPGKPLSTDHTETALVLAQKAQQFQEQEAAAGRFISMTEAVHQIKNTDTSQTGAINKLAREAQHFQEQEAAAGRYISMTEAVHHVNKTSL